MKELDCVTFKGKYGRFKKGARAVIVELYEDICDLEIFDKDGYTIDLVYDVPISALKPRKK